MYNNTFGNIFRLTSFGESHGKAICLLYTSDAADE